MDKYSLFVRGAKVLLLTTSAIVVIYTLSFSTAANRVFDKKTLHLIKKIQARGVGGLEYFELIDGSDDIKISASSVSLNEPQKLEDVVAKLVSKQGRELILTSDEGTVDRRSNIASFNKNVIVTTAEGIKLYTDQLCVNAIERSGESPGRTRVKGASWDLTADFMQTRRDEQEGKRFVIFTGSMKLVYFPRKEI